MTPRRCLVALLLAVLAITFAACGDDDPTIATEAPAGEPAASTEEAALEHIHGLGVSPADGSLLVATHNGLFRAAKGETKVERVGDSQQDIMGFSVVSADRFIGSGHPSIPQMRDEGLPPLLGLIESRDGGKTWKNVSLLGEADFHVLRSAGERIYGFDGQQGLMVSSDGGRTWERRSPPGAVFDIAIDPRDAERVLLSTEQGLFVSADAGKTFKPRRNDLGGLLAWPRPGAVYLVTGDGQVLTSSDGGQQFGSAGNIGGQPAAFVADGDDLYAATADGAVKVSGDGGATWTPRAAP
jgi:hypothetical protein